MKINHTTGHEWRLVGVDARQHAFHSEGGYIERIDIISAIQARTETEFEQVLVTYEAYIGTCGIIVPAAMLMPLSSGDHCLACRIAIDHLLRLDDPHAAHR